MKKRSFLMAAFAAMFMASCSDNDLNQENGPQIAEKGGKVYMKVSIANPTNGSRALSDNPMFDNGKGSESKVENILFVFYNQAGNYVGQSPMKKAADGKEPANENEFAAGTTATGSIETVFKIVVPVNVTAGGTLPYYVVAYVNPSDTDQAKADNLEGTSQLERTVYKDNFGNFTMNNSVYYEGDAGLPVFATKIAKLATVKPTFDTGDTTPTTTIYVERLAAKVTVTKDTGENNPDLNMDAGTTVDDAVDAKVIKFHPVAWGLNATAKESYLVKQFRNSSGDVVSYAEVAKRFESRGTNWKAWNASDNHRSYWGTAMGYAFDNYPQVASQGVTGAPVNYYSYEQLTGEGKLAWGASTYCLEHTVTNASAPFAAYTSVVVAGYYTVGDTEDAASAATAKTFYTFKDATKEKQTIYMKDADMDKLLAVMAGEMNPVHVYNAETKEYEPVSTNLSTYYEVTESKNLDDGAKGGLLIPSRYAYLQLKPAVYADGAEYYYFTGNTYQKITSVTKTDVNRMLLSANPATLYSGGKAYYNIPIEQFGKIQVTENDETKQKIAYGTYGVVRNHSYKITVKGISGLGTGIADPTAPIIPPTEEQTYYVKTELNVLAWRVASQEVILGE